jgi:hypothetical protein
MTYEKKVAASSENLKNHSTQSEQYFEFLMLKLVVRKENDRL